MSVIAGATVIESPVCTPIGSTFSIEQTITTLSALSRISSSSYSFQPRMDSSRSTSVVGLSDEPVPGDAAQVVLVVGDAGAGAAHGEAGPDHDRVAELVRGREAVVHGVADRRSGRLSPPSSSTISLNDLPVLAAVDRLDGGADQLDAVLLEHAGLGRAIAVFSAVWPPRVASSASGRSLAMIFSTNSGVIGST